MRALALLAFAVAVAGCVSPETVAPAAFEPASTPRASALVGATEPTELVAPAFALLGALAKGGPVYGAGEPGVAAGLDGSLWVTFPGCDRGPFLVRTPAGPVCEHGLVYRSLDDGATWERLNDETTGRLTEDGPAANGDAEVVLDAAGVVYASDLGRGIQAYRSTDGGATWTHLGNLVPKEHWADRQWMAAAGEGHVLAAWMGGERGQRAVAVTASRDAGDTWTDVQYLGERIGWIGPVETSPDGERAYVVFTQPESGSSPPVRTEPRLFQVLVGVSPDGGATWEVADTGARVAASATGGHWSGVLMAPALDVTGDGTVVVAWSEEVLAANGLAADGAIVKWVASADGGATWTEASALSERKSAIMPWVVGGAGDRFAVAYFASDTGLDTEYVGRWDVALDVVDGARADAPQVVRAVVDRDVHVGGLCAKGGGCFTSGSDRALLDYFEATVTPDGRIFLAYPADPLQGGKHIEIRVALQESGTPLLVPPVAG